MKFTCTGCGHEWESDKREDRCEICGARVLPAGVADVPVPKRLPIITLFGILIVVFIGAVGVYFITHIRTQSEKEEGGAVHLLDELVTALDQYWMENDETYPPTLSALSAQGALPDGASLEGENTIRTESYRLFYFVKKGEEDETKFTNYILYARPVSGGQRHFFVWAKKTSIEGKPPKFEKGGPSYLEGSGSVNKVTNYEEALSLLKNAKPLK